MAVESTVDIDALRVFCAVASHRSFSKAAAQLGRDRSQVSRMVRALEAQAGAQLLVRTTRSVRLSPEGAELLARVTPALTALDGAVGALRASREVPAGEVTVTAPPDLGRAWLAPALVGFRAQHPGVRVRVRLTAQMLDLMTDGVDLALRVGRPGGDSLVARRLGAIVAGFYASHAYLDRRGAPRTPADLAAHERLWPTPPRRANEAPVGASAPTVRCDDFHLLAEMAAAGGGVALLPTFVAARFTALVRVLPASTRELGTLFLVSRREGPIPARVTALRNHLLAARPDLA